MRRAAGASSRHGSPVGLARAERAAFLLGAATLALTSVHHVYGAILYATPERYHAVGIAGAALAVMVAAMAVHRRKPGSPAGRSAWWWVFWLATATVPVLLFGAAEGFYNHAVKVAAYYGGVSEATLLRMYPSPTYELPNDLVFEATGVLQVVPAAAAGYYLVRLLRLRIRRSPFVWQPASLAPAASGDVEPHGPVEPVAPARR
jgi:hypothetical protein